MQHRNLLMDYLKEQGVKNIASFSDGALLNPVKFQLAAIETRGAILFADLPGYSKLSQELSLVECAYMVSHFFSWFEREAGKKFGGIVDKFIGDEIMVVFPHPKCEASPLQAAMHTTRAMLENDPWAFNPKIGIAEGPFAICVVGPSETETATAMGNTVNLAARCTESPKPHTIKIATDNISAVKKVFENDIWDIRPPELFEPKNMEPVKVVSVHRKTKWVTNFDYFKHVKEEVKYARNMGAIQNDS